MKRQIARTLRRIADKLQPEYLRSIEVEWKRDRPPYVDIELGTGTSRKRVTGYVVALDYGKDAQRRDVEVKIG